MADVSGKFFSAKKVRTGVSPSSPGVEQGEALPPVNPPGTSLNSVGLTMPSAFAVANSPLTSNGTIAVTGAGTVAQYVRGDGTLADFPESSGGGSSVSYYLNGSVSQGTIGGVAYLEMNKVPILGAGTDFTISANGYIASFITDAGDPNLLEIPGGNWNFESYFSASSGGGSPTFYVELYKVNAGGTATLIASNSANPELISFGTTIAPYFSSLAVPTTVLALTDRLSVRYYVTHSGRTITLHTEGPHLCQIITTFTTGLTALNGLTAQVQFFAVGSAGTDFNIASATATHTFNLPTASATNRGALSSADWTTFNNKENAITAGTTAQYYRGDKNFQTLNTSVVPELTNLYYTEARVNANANVAANTAARHNAVTLGTANGLSLSTQQLSLGLASAGVTGALSGTDWSTFNSKQQALNGTGFVKIIGTTISYDNSTYYLASNPSAFIALTALSGTAPIQYNNTTGAISITQSSGSTNGFLSSTDWTTFNNKQNALTNPVTGTGSAGQVAFWNGTTTQTGDSKLTFNSSTGLLTLDGDLSFTGPHTISTSTGNLTLATAAGNGNILITPNGTGNVGIGTITPLARLVVSNGSSENIEFTSGSATVNGGVIQYINRSGTATTRPDLNYYLSASGLGSHKFYTSDTERWRITSAGILQSNGAQTIQTSTGNLTIATAAGNGNILLNPNGTGQVTITNDAVINGINVGRGGGGISTNTRVGTSALNANTSGSANSSFGINAGLNNTTGSANSFFGVSAGASNITTSNNSFFGRSSGQSNTDSNNTFVGFESGSTKTTGANNSFFGALSGRFLADGATNLTISNNSVFIGYDTRSAADNQTNQIVIGHTAIGLGSNTTVIGNSSTTHGRWYGSLLLGTTTNVASSILTMVSTTQGFLPPRMTTTQRNAIASPATGLVVYDTTLNDPFYYNGTAWTMFQDGITLTTTGTSGAATLVGTTLNIPQYQAALTNPVTGTGTTNYLPKFTGASTIGNSIVSESGGIVSVAGRFSSSGNDFHSLIVSEGSAQLKLERTTTSTGLMYLGADNVGFKVFDSGFATRLTLTPSGNLGLGVTPSAWDTSTNVRVLQMNAGSIWGFSTVAFLMVQNSFSNTSGVRTYVNNGFASEYEQASGQHIWKTAPSGTAGAAISFTQAMTLGSNSGLSIGTPSAAPSQGLLVQGNVGIGGSPSFKLDVNSLGYGIQHYGNGSNYLRTYAGSSYQVIESNGTNQFGYFNGNFFVQTSATDRLTIASTGAATFSSSVTAASLLSTTWVGAQGVRISSAPSVQGVYLGNSGTTSSDYATIEMVGGTGGGSEIDFTIPSSDFIGRIGYQNPTNHMWFVTSSQERMRIFSDGNVLIQSGGTFTNAGFKLDVNGTGRFSSTLDTGGRITITADAGNEQFIIKRASNTNEQLIFGFHSSDYAKIQAVEQGVAFRPLALNQDGGNVLIGTTTDNGSRLRVNGSLALPHTTKTANYTLDNTDYTVGFDCASNRTATLPDATTCAGRIYVVYQYNTNAGIRSVTLDGFGSQTINGMTTYSLYPFCEYATITIQSNGSNWIIIGSNFTTDCM